MTDAVFTSPVLSDGRVFVIDGAGVVHALDVNTLERVWQFDTGGGKGNCNNVSSPAIAGEYLHVGTMAGEYYVLRAATGEVIARIDCGEVISVDHVGLHFVEDKHRPQPILTKQSVDRFEHAGVIHGRQRLIAVVDVRHHGVGVAEQ